MNVADGCICITLLGAYGLVVSSLFMSPYMARQKAVEFKPLLGKDNDVENPPLYMGGYIKEYSLDREDSDSFEVLSIPSTITS